MFYKEKAQYCPGEVCDVKSNWPPIPSCHARADRSSWIPAANSTGRLRVPVCPGKDRTFQFLDDVFTEVASLFPNEYVHIGGDEAFKGFWEKCPDCQNCMRTEGLRNVQELQAIL